MWRSHKKNLGTIPKIFSPKMGRFRWAPSLSKNWGQFPKIEGQGCERKRFHVWYVSLKKRFLGHLLYLIAIKIAYNINFIFTKIFKPFVQGDFNKFLQ